MMMARFRWIQCQLDTLKRCFTAVQLREALESLPEGLEETYERILLAISREKRGGGIARRALVWLVAALQPLELSQLVEVLSIDLDRRLLDPNLGPIHGHALLDTLSSLVTHNRETDTVKLSHFSVKVHAFVTLFRFSEPLDRNTLLENSPRKNTLITSTSKMLMHRWRESVWVTWRSP